MKIIETEHRTLKTRTRQLLQDLAQAQRELSETQRHLLGTRRHIFSLQDHRAFEELIVSVDQWITNYISPVFEDDHESNKALHYAKSNIFDGIFSTVQYDPRLCDVAHLPETEEDVIHACILHWMAKIIFHDGFQGISSKKVDFIDSQEQSLMKDNAPLYAVRTWKAQSYYAWTKTSEYQLQREAYIHVLASQLESEMAMFLQHKEAHGAVEALRSNIVEPAFTLKEGMMSSRESFAVEIEHNDPLFDDHRSEDSPIDFKWSDCLDVTNHHRPVSSDTLRQDHSKRLIPLFAKTPGLTMRKLQDDDTFGQPKVLVKQCLLGKSQHSSRTFVVTINADEIKTVDFEKAVENQ
ncbi:hypothetical protein PG997_012892 [Apiospora hydei]|uniref:Uncharacterized protein n=1 Tax=Apiospora hydei TaxID=1337664 RepID=A0ABR1V4M1_9PEZI